MSRARVADAFLALAAVAAVLAPLRTLFTPDTWIPVTVFMAGTVTLSGILLRLLIRRDLVVVLAQFALGILLTGWLFASDNLWWGLPTWQTVLDVNSLLYDARMTITTSAPPAAVDQSMIVALALIGWIATLSVDILAVTRLSPALAGIPLLTAFLISASNSGSGLPMWYFLASASLWLVLLRRVGTKAFGGWSAGQHGAAGDYRTTRRLAITGRTVGISALLVATLAAAILPHLPTRFLLDGLGRESEGVGGTGAMMISSTVNLARNLEDRSSAPVLAYRTTAASPAPLRVAILDLYQNGEWHEREIRGIPRIDGLVPVSRGEDSTTETIDVSLNNLAAPQLALPYPPISLTIDTTWQSRRDGTVLVRSRSDTYSADYLARLPSEETLQASEPVPPGVGNLNTDEASAGLIREVLDPLISPGMTPIDKARVIQDYLRGSDFTYSLELAEAPGDANLDPISNFLVTKQGYCTQFATAMVMMARAEGIPARFAIGFLEGTAMRDGGHSVVASDAHAWPELYFDAIGWLRFEPTPSDRSGGAPPYTSETYGEVAQPGATAGPTSAPTTAAPFERPDVPLDTAVPGEALESPSVWSRLGDRFWWFAGALLVGVLGAVTMPASAWWERRRRRRLALDESARVEVIWQDLLERLDDVGVTPPPDASPRQAGKYIWGETFLTNESRTALRRMVAAVEQARYARPGTSADQGHIATLEKDAVTISDNVVGSLQRHDRLRATWWPTAGVVAWHRLTSRLIDRMGDRLPFRRD